MGGKVGVQTLASGQFYQGRVSRDGSDVVSQATGKYTEAVRAGRVFVAANQAAVALTAAMATTYTGLVLSNPSTSNVDVVMLKFGYAWTVAVQKATAMGLMTGLNAGDAAAAITPRNRLTGGPGSQVIVDNGCSLTGTPVLEQVFGSAGTLATTGPALEPVTDIDLDGSLIVTPGYYVAVYSFADNTAGAICYFMWEEVPRI